MCDRSTSPPNGEGTEKQDENKKRHHVALLHHNQISAAGLCNKNVHRQQPTPFFYTVWSSLIEIFLVESNFSIFSGI